MNSPDHSTKGTPSLRGRSPRRALTACKCRVSGSISFPLRGAFHLSLTVLVRYRWPKVVRLGGWSPQLPTGFRVSRGTQEQEPASRPASGTGLSPPMVWLSRPLPLSWPVDIDSPQHHLPLLPYNPSRSRLRDTPPGLG